MNEAVLTLDIRSAWHAGTGRGSGPDLDAEVFRTPEGLPCLPGRTVKGLLREAVEAAEDAGVYGPGAGRTRSLRWFGSALAVPARGGPGHVATAAHEARFLSSEGTLLVDSALLGATDEDAARWRAWAGAKGHQDARDQLFRSVASTRLDASGIAADHTLRAIEVVVPVTLHARIRSADDGWQSELAQALLFLDAVGSHRTRGFGRCVATLTPRARPPAHPPPHQPAPEALRYRYTLLRDVAVTARAATASGHRTLEYLPGASILGAVAASLYRDDEAWTRAHDWTLFFSGEVRFGDATLGGSAPAPLSLCAPKDLAEKPAGAHPPVVNRVLDERPDARVEQLRDLWVTPDGRFVRPARRRSMRTAMGDGGRARDGLLYEIEALAEGQTFEGEITVDTGDPARDADIRARIHRALNGATIRLGRSARQEYGEVQVEAVETPSAQFLEAPAPRVDDELVVWCISDVCLVDERAQATFAPTAEHFHLPAGWSWDAARSFVRMAAWAPFRNRRSSSSAAALPYAKRPGGERSVLAGGSVLVFRRGVGAPAIDLGALRRGLGAGVGLHTSEGLGRVRIEPALLTRPLPPAPADVVGGPPLAAAPPPEDAVATWALAQAAERRRKAHAWSRANLLLGQLRRADRLPAAQWGALRDELRRHAAGDVAAALQRYLRPPVQEAHQRAPDARAPRGGGGQRRSVWVRHRVGALTYAEWLEAAVAGDPALAREALLIVCELAVRQQRARDDEGGRP